MMHIECNIHMNMLACINNLKVEPSDRWTWNLFRIRPSVMLRYFVASTKEWINNHKKNKLPLMKEFSISKGWSTRQFKWLWQSTFWFKICLLVHQITRIVWVYVELNFHMFVQIWRSNWDTCIGICCIFVTICRVGVAVMDGYECVNKHSAAITSVRATAVVFVIGCYLFAVSSSEDCVWVTATSTYDTQLLAVVVRTARDFLAVTVDRYSLVVDIVGVHAITCQKCKCTTPHQRKYFMD